MWKETVYDLPCLLVYNKYFEVNYRNPVYHRLCVYSPSGTVVWTNTRVACGCHNFLVLAKSPRTCTYQVRHRCPMESVGSWAPRTLSLRPNSRLSMRDKAATNKEISTTIGWQMISLKIECRDSRFSIIQPLRIDPASNLWCNVPCKIRIRAEILWWSTQ